MSAAPSLKLIERQGFAEDLHQALGHKPRSISPKYFYDEAGSALFEHICQLREYYPTRTEMALLRQHATDIADLMGPGAQLLEYGAGALNKVRCLLKQMRQPHSFVPIDISGPHLLQACSKLQAEFPTLAIEAQVGDFTGELRLPAAPTPGRGRRFGFFPGSSIGNFSPEQALDFLRLSASQLRGGGLLIGVDLIKDPALLHAAYNDSEGVTARFNLNILERARRELGARFPADGFSHSAFYNAPLQRIEMHLLSLRKQVVELQGVEYTFEAGETLHTENSYKYSVASFQALAGQAGYRPGPVWTDEQHWFSLHWLHSPID
ncbi:L-histidine N(alpha)-methyltransferase [Paucibacter sp. Y2R2-4]|uniref:L-histidine N(alpha)-methyltransferase n=1 Tax=Paucibacter sp. Y2R2-4 TaxID=2893553 RepID=UPI0021E4DF19|nr:L-histidine N(alpha)-methyltransferase [Paucibacter sp. Y2R2-4]MCV2350729.1 L-histidine N(alpha)-methyltransferase [Paucibacter sp. Y2R2-4]